MNKLHNIFPAAKPIPEAWKKTLQFVDQFTWQGASILSGGALRDWGHGVPVKDLDIFVPWSRSRMDAVCSALEDDGWCCVQNIPASCEGLGEVVAVIGYRKPGELDLNIVFLDEDFDLSITGVLDRNDFGICQIAGRINGLGEWEFEYSDHFIADVMNKTFTLIRKGGEERSFKRFNRLKEKYPDHILVTPYYQPVTDMDFLFS